MRVCLDLIDDDTYIPQKYSTLPGRHQMATNLQDQIRAIVREDLRSELRNELQLSELRSELKVGVFQSKNSLNNFYLNSKALPP